MMKIIHKNKELEIIECTSFITRLKGFMFKKNINYALKFPYCNSIHTFFMKEDISVIMCNKDYKVLHYYPRISKNKIIWPKKDVYYVIEAPVNYFNIKVNERIEITK